MICCNNCPFHPQSGFAEARCSRPICSAPIKTDHQCVKLVITRCFLDSYVLQKLYHGDHLAMQLAKYTLQKAVIGRDRALIISLFHAANEEMKFRLWNWLEKNEPRSLWLLNPIFSSAGLLPIGSFKKLGSKKRIYLDALMANPYAGSKYQTVCSCISLKGATS